MIAGREYDIVRKVNGENATVWGVEMLYQQPFAFLPGWLDGFEVVATYAYIEGKTPIRDPNGRKLSFPGLSQNNINLILYFEPERFNARIAYNWRDDFLLGINSAGSGDFFDSYDDLALTSRFQVTEHVSVGFEALNLLDSELRTYSAVPEALRSNVIYGRIFKFTVSAIF